MLSGIYSAFSQDLHLKNEADLIKKADNLFKKEEYVQAFSMYQTLLSNHKDDAEYNFRYAVCLMFSDRSDKTKPIFYLEKAANSPDIDSRLYYFLGRAYQMNYQFTDAIESYNKYKEKSRSAIVEKYNINRRIEECDNGILLLEKVRGIYVISNVEVKETSFYRSYNLENASGKIIVLPEELRTKYDQKNDAPTTAFYVSKVGLIYFTSYGEKNVSGLDIYRAHQNPDGTWAKAEKISDEINTPFDDAYPYVSPDGSSLYFSSKGHNSMGEYDIFKSVFSLASFSWTKPVNLSFPVNTPFDEIMFVPDTNNIYAYFSSNRNSIKGLIDVYRIGLNRRPEEVINLAGIYKGQGDLKIGIEQVKEMANLQANIQWDAYNNKPVKHNDFIAVSGNDSNQIQPLRVNDERNEITLSKSEAVDSVFNIYKKLKLKEAELNEHKSYISKTGSENLEASVAAIADGYEPNSVKVRQLIKNSELCNEISKSLDIQISRTITAYNAVINMTGPLQKYAISEQYDSIYSILNKSQKIFDIIENQPNVTGEILAVEQNKVSKIREQASEYFNQTKKIDTEIDNLEKEKNEYAEAARTYTDAITKQDYMDMAKAMDGPISKKKAEKDKVSSQWKLTRNLADSIGDNLALSSSIIDNYTANNDLIKNENQENIAKFIHDKKLENQNAYGVIADKNQVAANELPKNNENIKIVQEQKKKQEADSLANIALENQGKEKVQINLVQEQKKKQEADSLANIALQNQEKEKVQINLVQEQKKKQEADSLANIALENQGKEKVQINLVQEQRKNQESDSLANITLENQEKEKVKINLVQEQKKKQESDSLANIALENQEKEKVQINLVQEQKKNQEADSLANIALENQEKEKVQIALVQEQKKKQESDSLANITLENQEKEKVQIALVQEQRKKQESDSLANIVVNSQVKVNRQDSINEIIAELENQNVNKEKDTNSINKAISLLNDTSEQMILTANQNRILAASLIESSKSKSNFLLGIASEKVDLSSSLIIKIDDLEKRRATESDSLKKILIVNQLNKNKLELFNLETEAETAYKISKSIDAKAKDAAITLDEINAASDSLELLVQNGQIESANELSDKIENDLSYLNQQLSIDANEQDEKLNLKSQLDDIVSDVKNSKNQLAELNLNYKKIDISKQSKDSISSLIIDKQKQITDLNKDYEFTYKKINNLEASERIIQQLNNADTSIIDSYEPSFIVLNNISQNIVNKRDSVIFSEAIISTIIDEKKENNEVFIAKIETDTVANFPMIKYTTDEQNQAAESYLNPVVLKINSTQSKVKSTNQSIITSSNLASDYFIKADSLRQESVNLLNQLKNSENLEQSKLLAAKIVENQKEITNLQRNASSENILANEYQKAKIDDEKQLNNLTITYNEVASSIENNDFNAAKDKSNLNISENQNSINSSEQLAISLCNVLDKRNEVLDSKISKSTTNINDLINKQKEIKSQIEVVEDNSYLSENEQKKAKLEIKKAKLQSQLDEINLEVAKINTVSEPMKAQIETNNNLKSNLLTIAKEIDKQKSQNLQENSQVLLTNSNIEQTVDTSIFASNSESNNLLIAQVEQVFTEKDSSNSIYLYSNSIDLVYFNNTDIFAVKKYLINNKLNLIKKKIEVLRILRSNSSNIDERMDIGNEISKLESMTDDLTDKLAEYELSINNGISHGDKISYNDKSMTSNQVAQRLNSQAEKLLLSSDSLTSLSEMQKRSVKNGMKTKAKVLMIKANKLTTDAAEIVAIANNNTYIENTIELASINKSDSNDIRIKQANEMIAESQRKVEQSIQNRDAAKNPKLSTAEKYSIQQEAASLEQIAINEQKQALEIYKNKSVQDSLFIVSQRNAEEIPNDLQVAKVEKPNTEIVTNQVDSLEQKIIENPEANNNEIATNQVDSLEQKIIENPVANNNEIVNQRKTYNVEAIAKANPIELANISVEYLSPEVRQEVEMRRSEIVGIYLENVNNNNTAFYNEKNPIVTNKPLPEGLIYKVQIAAFKREVNPINLKGIKPINIEKIQNSAWLRYMAGLFTSYDDALSARNQIRGLGFKDAFIVPYFNGERISIVESRLLIQRGEAFTDKAIVAVAEKIQKNVYIATNVQLAKTENLSISNSNLTDFAVPELYYTVQIGVYATPRTKEMLFNISDIFFDRTKKAYYRYFSGKYIDYQEAISNRNLIRNAGVPDAFILAFHKGERISVAEARNIVVEQKPELIPEPKPEIKANELEILGNKQIIIYKVQLGAYRNNIPIEVVNSLLQTSVKGIETELQADGITIYLTGNFSNYQDARALRDEIVNNGIPEAFVAAFADGKKISIEEALNINENK